jgi:hypothetical protein
MAGHCIFYVLVGPPLIFKPYFIAPILSFKKPYRVNDHLNLMAIGSDAILSNSAIPGKHRYDKGYDTKDYSPALR